MSDLTEQRKAKARTWFEELRDRICAEFERIEAEAGNASYSSVKVVPDEPTPIAT